MQSNARGHAERLSRVAYFAGAADSACRAIEGSIETVTSGIHFMAAVDRKRAAHSPVVRIAKVAPTRIAQFCRQFGRADDVTEHYRLHDAVLIHRTPAAGQEFLYHVRDFVGAHKKREMIVGIDLK